jgi:hypothetical protein
VNVTITRKDGETITYGYAPEHFAGVNLFYAEELAAGKIVGYVIRRDGCYTVPVFATDYAAVRDAY